MALAERSRLEEAIPHFERAVALDPAGRDARANLGRAYNEALPQYEKALERSPGSTALRSQIGKARYFLGVTLWRNGQRPQALAQWRQALVEDPDNLQVLNETAWELATCPDAALRNGTEAVRLAAHAVELTSGHDPALLATLAAAYGEGGHFDKAMDLEKRAADLAAEQGNSTLAGTLHARLRELQAKNPIRQP